MNMKEKKENQIQFQKSINRTIKNERESEKPITISNYWLAFDMVREINKTKKIKAVQLKVLETLSLNHSRVTYTHSYNLLYIQYYTHNKRKKQRSSLFIHYCYIRIWQNIIEISFLRIFLENMSYSSFCKHDSNIQLLNAYH